MYFSRRKYILLIRWIKTLIILQNWGSFMLFSKQKPWYSTHQRYETLQHYQMSYRKNNDKLKWNLPRNPNTKALSCGVSPKGVCDVMPPHAFALNTDFILNRKQRINFRMNLKYWWLGCSSPLKCWEKQYKKLILMENNIVKISLSSPTKLSTHILTVLSKLVLVVILPVVEVCCRWYQPRLRWLLVVCSLEW